MSVFAISTATLSSTAGQHSSTMQLFRNDVAFHLGWPDKTVPRMADLANRRACEIFVETDGDRRTDARFTGAENLLIQSSELRQKDFRGLAELSITACQP